MARNESDGRIAARVQEALEHDPRLRPQGISVAVRHGVVTLGGTVGRYLDRMAAAEDAWQVEGVEEVRNRLRVEPDRIRSSEEIATDVAEALARDERFNARGIVVEVAEGIARLSGTVATGAERRVAEEHAWRTEGIVDVANDLVVSPDRRRPDRQIEQDVREALLADAALSDPTPIAVRSIAGTVRLEGSVPSAEERAAAERDAWYTGGTIYVENRLRITGGRRGPAAA